MPNEQTLPSIADAEDLSTVVLGKIQSPALQIMLNTKLYNRVIAISKIMANAVGVTPKHLLDQPQACFAVVSRAITWKLDPFAVACSTYATPGGAVGFEGKLCQAILENSGMIDGGVKYEHIGDWSKVRGKHVIKKSDKGRDYAAIGWKPEDEEGLGVIVSATVHGEKEPRTWTLYLKQCFPRNSTLWALDPESQICYTAVRRFGSLAAPGIFMGVPFDREDSVEMHYGPDNAIDVTPPPRPTRETATEKDAAEERKVKDTPVEFELIDEAGVSVGTYGPKEYVERLHAKITSLRDASAKEFECVVENNDETLAAAAKAFNGGDEARHNVLDDINAIRRYQDQQTAAGEGSGSRAPSEPEQTQGQPTVTQRQPEADEIDDDTSDLEPEEIEVKRPAVPATFDFKSSTGKLYKFTTIEKWEDSIMRMVLKSNDPQVLKAAYATNKDIIDAYAKLGEPYAASAARVVKALEGK